MSDRPGSAVDYKPISHYGVIGDMHTAALVALDGSIDWFCAPRFDSPSVFAALLDVRKGGKFQLSPTENSTTKQSYEGDTNVLSTIFESKEGKIKLTDFMPCFMEKGEAKGFQELHRIVDCVEGEAGLRIIFQPRLDYARGNTTLLETAEGCTAKNRGIQVNLASSVKLRVADSDILTHEFRLSKGQRAVFVLKWGKKPAIPATRYETSKKLSKTLSYWKRWVGHVKYQGPFRANVVRSCLVLKLLQYAPTGAMVAAVTTSLPESVGTLRNWDYRYSWIRDNALSVIALSEAGASREALDYARWLTNLRRHSKEKLQIMMGIGGEREIPETTLDHLEGYRRSSPVRVGNAASKQLQLDVYGILADYVYFLHTLGWTTGQVYENLVRYSADQAMKEWQSPDSGIWEIRQPKMFVESTMWCYVALDRAIKMARELGYDEDWRRWEPVRKKIKSHILSEELSEENLIYRYRVDDGQLGKEGTFTVCSFWMVDCLTRLGKLRDAEGLLNQLTKRSNHLGLYSEEIDPKTGEALGNFPQAYTHMGLITASVHLEEARRKTGLIRYAKAISNKISGR